MSEWIYGTILKADASTVVARKIYIQIDKIDAKEASEYQGTDPHFTYKMVTRQLPANNVNLIQQRYYVIDQQVIDPETNALRKFLIVSDPTFKQLVMEWTWMAYRMRGT